MPSLRKAPTKDEQAIALLTDPHFYRYFDHLVAQRGAGGTATDLACFIADVSARIYGNRQQAAAAARLAANWGTTRRVVKEYDGRDLPAAAPSADTVRKWRFRWFLTQKDIARAAAMNPDRHLRRIDYDQLLDLATELGVQRACKLGQYRRGKARDFANPDPCHTLAIDGTYLGPFSQAHLWEAPNGAVHRLKSKAKNNDAVRQQETYHVLNKDGRKVMGVNHVVAVTRTRYGRVCLGYAQALGGENAGVVTVVDRVVTHAGDGLHSVTVDGVAHGWTREYLTARHGVQVLMPAKAAAKDPTDQEKIDSKLAEQELRLDQIDVEETLRRTGNSASRRNAKLPKGRPNKSRIKALAHHKGAQRHDLPGLIERTEKGLPTGHGLPLGTCHYVSSQKKLVTVRSKPAYLRTLTHPAGHGPACSHELHVDDGALWEVDWRDGKALKYQRVVTLTSVPRHTGEEPYNVHSQHELICHKTGEILGFDTVWYPSATGKPLTKAETKARSTEQEALALMTPLARCDAKYRKAYGLRNDIESWFFDLKHRLLEDKRAASLDLEHQLLDVLYVGIITNALALRAYRYES